MRALGVAVLVALLASNVVLHQRIERNTHESWRAMQRSTGDALLPTTSLSSRHALYFELRSQTQGGFEVRVPQAWDGTAAQANFSRAIEGPLLTIARARSVVPGGGDLFRSSLDLERVAEMGAAAGLRVSSGRSRFNPRSEWYDWVIVTKDAHPIAMTVLADDDLKYMLVDSRIPIAELDGSAG